ncbi:MAG: hypothetical protein E5Y30_32240, partial [Mesorhizobium sp.]
MDHFFALCSSPLDRREGGYDRRCFREFFPDVVSCFWSVSGVKLPISPTRGEIGCMRRLRLFLCGHPSRKAPG